MPGKTFDPAQRQARFRLLLSLLCQLCQAGSKTSFNTITPWVIERSFVFPWHTRYIPSKPACRLAFRCSAIPVDLARHGTSWNALRYFDLSRVCLAGPNQKPVTWPTAVLLDREGLTRNVLSQSQAIQARFRIPLRSGKLGSVVGGRWVWEPRKLSRHESVRGLAGKVAPGLNPSV